jgi:hypothetical protein
MAKDKNTQATEATVTKPIDELKAKGTLTLTANSREELFAKFDELKADADGMELSCGCVGQTADGNFVMNVLIIKE